MRFFRRKIASEHHMIPFSETSVEVIDDLVLDYLHPETDLSTLLEQQRANIEDQVYIQAVVKKTLNSKHQKLIDNLFEVNKIFFPDEKVVKKKLKDEDKGGEIYLAECQAFQKKIFDAAKSKTLEISQSNPRMFDDAMMHYSYRNKSANALLRILITSTSSYHVDLIPPLIKYGGRIYGKHDQDCTLSYAVAYQLPLGIIQSIYEVCPHSSYITHVDWSEHFTSLIYAATQPLESDVLDFLCEKFPYEIEATFELLLKIRSSTNSFVVTLNDVEKFIFHEDSTTNEAILRFLTVTKNFMLNTDKVLNFLLDEFKKLTKMDEFLNFSDAFLKLKSFDHFPKKRFSFNLFHQERYTKEKIIFIEKIRNKIHDHLADFNVVRTVCVNEQTLTYYKEECEKVLRNDVFSKAHEECGVDAGSRIRLAQVWMELMIY